MLTLWRRPNRRNSQPLPLLKKLFWLYFLLLVFEGALRKWILPHYSAPLLLIRDPVGFWIIWEAYRTREEAAGLDWQNRIGRASALVTTKYGVPGLKYAMDLNGYYGGPPRLPLTVPTAAAKQEIEEAFKDLKG